ncbi:MAG: ABC transporter permease subunit [Phycisphaerae bacterium]|nr:ABC transporter permease subunit [Phycisphaerae bacterium]
MRNLLWKDFWQNSRVLLAVAIVAAAPYVAGLIIVVVDKLFWSSGPQSGLAGVEGVCWASAWLSVFMAAFLGGNAIAGERTDRSAEFAAGLPIPRGPSVASKAIAAGLPCVTMWALNAAVLGTITWLQRNSSPKPFGYDDRIIGVAMCGCCSILLFGLAWFFASMLKSPVISAAAALGTVAAIVVIAALSLTPAQRITDDQLVCLFGIAAAVGLLSFAVGGIVCLRRAEP